MWKKKLRYVFYGESDNLRLLSLVIAAASVQIALRLPESDLAEARKIAARKGIGAIRRS
jgi:hypothetical protein